MIQVVIDSSGFAMPTMQWLIEISRSCRHLVCMCCRTMQLIDLAGEYRRTWTFPDRNMEPVRTLIPIDRLVMSAYSHCNGSTMEFNWTRVCFNIMHYE